MVLESDALRAIYYYFLGRPECLTVCYEYYVVGLRPSEIMEKYGLGRISVRGCISRVRVGRKSENSVTSIIKDLYNLLKLNPNIPEYVFEMSRYARSYKCLWCDRRFRKKTTLALHISQKHLEKFDSFIRHISTYGKVS
ncbi:MAG: hypothetical protein QXO22_06440 [Thermosphaera sp.]